MGFHRRFFQRMFVVATAAMLAACVPNGARWQTDTHATRPASLSVVIGDISADGPEDERLVRRYRRALIRALKESGTPLRVQSPPPTTLSPSDLVITARLIEIDPGSEALRYFLGYGAGIPSLTARIDIEDSQGNGIASFNQHQTWINGSGYDAHWEPFEMDDAIDTLGRKSGRTVLRWLGRDRPG